MFLETRELNKFVQEQVLHLAFNPWITPNYFMNDEYARALIDILQAKGHVCHYRYDGTRERDRYTAMINDGPRVDSDTLADAIAQAVCAHFKEKQHEQG